MHYREWSLYCGSCDLKFKKWCWEDKLPVDCPQCSKPSEHYVKPEGYPAPMVIGDEILGHQVRHGVCWPDGSPRRFDSKTDLKKALNEAGLTIKGDTPKPYSVGWSGIAKDPTKT